jgi:hypothetical protein
MHPFKTTFDIETYDPNTDTYTKTGDADDITGWVGVTSLPNMSSCQLRLAC